MKGFENFLKSVNMPGETAKKERPFLVTFTARIVGWYTTKDNKTTVLHAIESYEKSQIKYDDEQREKEGLTYQEYANKNNLWYRRIYLDDAKAKQFGGLIATINSELTEEEKKNWELWQYDITFSASVGAYLGTDGKAYLSLWSQNIIDWNRGQK